MSETDSFIEEVTEEVRRDKLFAFFRKYGWIAILSVILLVGGAAFNEWQKASQRAAAQALGDAVIAANALLDATARADALAAIEGNDAETRAVLRLLEAAERVADDPKAALGILDQLSADTKAPEIYRDLASLKAVAIRGNEMNKDQRLAALAALSKAGSPFRAVALEQTALAYVDFGNNDKAIEILLMILDEPDATQGLIQRVQQLIVALGGTLPGA